MVFRYDISTSEIFVDLKNKTHTRTRSLPLSGPFIFPLQCHSTSWYCLCRFWFSLLCANRSYISFLVSVIGRTTEKKVCAFALWSLKFSGAQRTRHNHFATAVWLLLLLVLLLLLLVVVLQIISLFANTRARTTLAAHKFMCTQNDERDTKSKWEKNNRATEMERANAKNDRAENTLWHVLRTLLFRIVCECVCVCKSEFFSLIILLLPLLHSYNSSVNVL